MDFKKGVLEKLREHAGLVTAGIPTDQALRIVCREGMTFDVSPPSLANKLRLQLNFAESNISQTMTSLLSRCSEAQLDRVVLMSDDIKITNPERPNCFMRLAAIAHSICGWVVEFDCLESDGLVDAFLLSQLFQKDVLSMLEVVERVLRVEPRNTER